MPKIPDRLPPYADLPTIHDVDHVAWGLFGADDQVGMFNLQTPERIVEAARLVRKGAMFSLNWKLELPEPALYNRQPMRHSFTVYGDGWGHDDWYDNFFPQSSSQWDALIHVGTRSGRFYNGVTIDRITGGPGTKLGIENWAERGIAGRCVLLDFARWWDATHDAPLVRNAIYAITPDDMEALQKYHGVKVGTGDVLLLRTGWMEWYETASQEERDALGNPRNVLSAGLSSTIDMAEYIWNLGVCAVASDNTALESHSRVDANLPAIFLHFYMLGRFGMAIGEMFDLEKLAADCAADGVYEGLLVSAPLNKRGGAGSPPNAIVLK